MVGAVEPEVTPWLRAAGHAPRAVRDAAGALALLEREPADLVIVDREPAGLDAAGVCRALRDGVELSDPWLLAITVPAKGRGADAALDAGADDYLHRPFTRGELLARARAGVRAAQQRADDMLVRALLVNVPGAIYRSAWHAGNALELISDEIERISGYPPVDFVASAKRTLMSIVHPRDRKRVARSVAAATADPDSGFVVEYRIVRADGQVRWVLDRGQLVHGPGGRLWMDGALFDVTERRAAEEALRRQEIDRARTEELRASRVRIVEAADAARRRIERDLHDGAQQRLVALGLDVRVARKKILNDPSTAAAELDRIGQGLAEASAELRELARGIHPAVLTERGLAAAVEALGTRAPVPVEVVEVPRERLSPSLEATAYFTVAEALTNVAKYAGASHATVRIAQVDSELVVEVADDGVGGADASNGSGLSGLADRVGASDGTLSVSSPPGRGTTIRAVVPAPLLERRQPRPRVGQRQLRVGAQRRDVVLAGRRRGHRALEHARQLGVAQLVEPPLRAGDRGLQRGDPARALAAGGLRRVRRRVPLAHEVGDRLGVVAAIRVVEALHERLGVLARVGARREVGVHALGGVAEQPLQRGGRDGLGRRRDRARLRGRAGGALVGPAGAGRVAAALEDLRLDVVQLREHGDDLARVVGLEHRELGLEHRVLGLDLRQPVAHAGQIGLADRDELSRPGFLRWHAPHSARRRTRRRARRPRA